MLHTLNEGLVIYLQDVLIEAELVFRSDTLIWCLAGDALASSVVSVSTSVFRQEQQCKPDIPSRLTCTGDQATPTTASRGQVPAAPCPAAAAPLRKRWQRKGKLA